MRVAAVWIMIASAWVAANAGAAPARGVWELRADLDSPDPRVQANAARGLAEHGAAAAAAVPRLVELLRAERQDVARRSMSVLGYNSPGAAAGRALAAIGDAGVDAVLGL